jgi:hypothetical protein
MALVIKDRVRETSIDTGTGVFNMLGAVTGYQTFTATIGSGNTTYYTIANQGTNEWEVGVGTVGTNTLTRDVVLDSSNSGSLVNFSSGTKEVFVTYPADKAVSTDLTQTLTNKTITFANNTLTGVAPLNDPAFTGNPTAPTQAAGNNTTRLATTAFTTTAITNERTATTTLTNKTISGSNNTLSNIGNASLTNSSLTVNGTAIALGASGTITAANPQALTIGTGLSGTSYNGSSAVTVAVDSTVATLTGTQTLTNKTIAFGSNTLTDVASTNTTQTLTNKTISGANNTISNVSLTTGVTGTLPLANGGTNATTAAQAKINLAVITAATGSEIIPAGTEAQRDVTPLAGFFRFNTTTSRFEGYSGTAWGSVGGGATGGGIDEIFYENEQVVTTNYTLTTGKNAMTAGPITVDDGVTVTVPSGSAWTVV